MLKRRKKPGRSHLVSLLPSLSWYIFRYGLPVLRIVDNLDDTTDIVLRGCHLVYRYIPMRTKQTQDWTTIFKSSSIPEAPRSVDEFCIVAPGVTRECFRIEYHHEKPVLQKAKICVGASPTKMRAGVLEEITFSMSGQGVETLPCCRSALYR